MRKKLLAKLGVTHVTVVPEQETPDGNFPPARIPTRKSAEAMQKGLELCDKVHPDLLLGTDPTVTAAAPPCPTARAATG